ncbi:MAG: sulfur carrier protein ThiS [Muribaculaceae bacterium]|nr:sulfur carrier protein ThiS [Muribaculaceae bacterium]
MTIEINNRTVEVSDEHASLLQLLEREGLSGKGKAVAVNNKVVPRTEWENTQLNEGMKITVISAVCGG